MSYRTHLNDKFHRNESIVSKSRLFFISPERVDTIAGLGIFFYNIVDILLLLLCNTCMKYNTPSV